MKVRLVGAVGLAVGRFSAINEVCVDYLVAVGVGFPPRLDGTQPAELVLFRVMLHAVSQRRFLNRAWSGSLHLIFLLILILVILLLRCVRLCGCRWRLG